MPASPSPRTLVLVANQAWNLVNYRAGLIRALLAQGYSVVAVAPPEPGMSERLQALGCRFEPLPLDPKGLSPLAEARTFLRLLSILLHERPAGVLSWTIKANLWGALAARFCGVASIPNVSGLGEAHDHRLLQRVAASLYRVCFARCSTIFFQNETDRAALVGPGLIDLHQARLLPGSGVDLEYFKPTRLERPESRRYVLVARLLAAKGVREFVAAAQLVRQQRADLQFALIGFLDVANRTAIPRSEVETWVAEGLIEYIPAVDDIRPLLEDCEAVVLPSYYREGLSRALLEAGAMGRPAITTDMPGCREAIVDGATGFLCEPRDASSLARAILRLAALDESKWRAMGAAARKRIIEGFSEQVVIDRYLDALARAGLAISRPTP